MKRLVSNVLNTTSEPTGTVHVWQQCRKKETTSYLNKLYLVATSYKSSQSQHGWCSYDNPSAESGCAAPIVRPACSNIFQATGLCFSVITVGDVCTDGVCAAKECTVNAMIVVYIIS